MKKTFILISLAAMLAGLCSCSDDKTNGGSNTTTKVTLAFGKYYTAQGTVQYPTWAAGSYAGAIDATNGASGTAKALGSGESSAIFLFPLKGAVAKDQLVCFYPADAVTYEKNQVVTAIATAQDATVPQPVQIGTGSVSASNYTGANINMQSYPCLLMATVMKGSYSIVKAEMTAIGGENIAGSTVVDPSTLAATPSEKTITVTPATPVDCRNANAVIPIYVAPVTLSKGFNITYTTDSDETFVFTWDGAAEFPVGGKVETDAASSTSRKLIACGSDKVLLFDAAIAKQYGYYNMALLWSWSSTGFAFGSSSDHIDDCKVVNDGKQFLVTCSNGSGWCALVNYPAGDVAWYVSGISNAHSSELLPGGRIVVACSDGTDKIMLYDTAKGQTLVSSNELHSAHGVVWMDSVQKLYAIGGTDMQVYALKDWSTSSPSLSLQKTYTATGYAAGLHDMSKVNNDYLIVGGSNSNGHSGYLYNINTEAFTAVNHLNGITGMKSVNYNMDTGELYYTYAAAGTSEGGYDWSSWKVRYTDDITKPVSGDGTGSSNWSFIWVRDINMYKVRVYNW